MTFIFVISVLTLTLCVENTKSLEKISEDTQKGFAKTYNDVRSRYARGEVEGFPSVTNMMEASWNKKAAELAEDIVSQLCSKGSFAVFGSGYHILFSSSEDKEDVAQVWAQTFYSDPKKNDVTRIQQTIRPEVTEVGCAVSFCRNVSYAVCAHGKTTCPGPCIKYDTGPVCSKCPAKTKCTFDGLCSTRKKVRNIVSRIAPEYQSSFVRWVNIARSDIANGYQKFDRQENGTKKEVVFPTAARMMEVKWSDSAAEVAESAMVDYCINGNATYDSNQKYHLIAASYYADFYDIWTPDDIIPIVFEMSDTAWPLFLTSEFSKSANYTDFFSMRRRNIFTGRDDITEIGCSFDYCRESAVTICAMGEIICKSNCTVYENGKTCSNCPTGSKCTFDGLCSFRKEATTNFTKISKETQSKIIKKINEEKSIISIGQHEYTTTLDGIRMSGKMPTAAYMMEIEWADFCVDSAETAIVDWCQNGNSNKMYGEFKIAAFSQPVTLENSTRDSEYWDIDMDYYFTPSLYEWPLVVTAKDLKSENILNIFDWARFDIFVSWASISYIGCAMEYCRGEIVLMCSMGSFGNCTDNCKVYEKGNICSSCPENTTCSDTHLCRRPRNSTAEEEDEEQLIDETQKGNNAENLPNSCFLCLFWGLILKIY